MKYIALEVLIICILTIISITYRKSKYKKYSTKSKYDSRGFDHNHIHRNGTKYDDFGFDFYGYNSDGYNSDGYNACGKNNKGQYNRLFDAKSCDEEGFYDPKQHPIALSTHARERMKERLRIFDFQKMDKYAIDAYRFGRSKRQIKKSSAYLVDEIEQRDKNNIVLIYRNYIYIFSCENVLITVYKNDKIPL